MLDTKYERPLRDCLVETQLWEPGTEVLKYSFKPKHDFSVLGFSAFIQPGLTADEQDALAQYAWFQIHGHGKEWLNIPFCLIPYLTEQDKERRRLAKLNEAWSAIRDVRYEDLNEYHRIIETEQAMFALDSRQYFKYNLGRSAFKMKPTDDKTLTASLVWRDKDLTDGNFKRPLPKKCVEVSVVFHGISWLPFGDTVSIG